MVTIPNKDNNKWSVQTKFNLYLKWQIFFLISSYTYISVGNIGEVSLLWIINVAHRDHLVDQGMQPQGTLQADWCMQWGSGSWRSSRPTWGSKKRHPTYWCSCPLTTQERHWCAWNTLQKMVMDGVYRACNQPSTLCWSCQIINLHFTIIGEHSITKRYDMFWTSQSSSQKIFNKKHKN